MNKTTLFLISVFVLFVSACSSPHYVLKSVEGTMVLMDDSFDKNKNQTADSILNYYRGFTAQIMDSIIGYNNVFMDKGLREESALGNFAADIVAIAADEIFNTKVDMGLMNRGGLRTSLQQGNITLGDVFKVFPFENHVTLLEIKGRDLRALLEKFAATNVQCISRIELVVKDKKLKTVLVGGEPIDDEKIYKIGTIDFIAEGGDSMPALKNAVNRYDSPVLIRDAIAKFISENSPLEWKKDGRIIYE